MGNAVSDLALLPLRVIGRAFDDVHRLARAAEAIGAAARSASASVGSLEQRLDAAIAELAGLREQVEGVNGSTAALPGEARRLAVAFDRSNDEAARIRGELSTLIERLTEAQQAVERLAGDIAAMRQITAAVPEELGDMRDAVAPLKSATERIGRAADRLPGSGRRSASEQ